MKSFGPYTLTRKIGEGGTAEVWEAQSPSGERVAIKRLLPALAAHAEVHAAFDAERRIAQRLTHPNIVRVIDGGEAEGLPFLVMEHIDGLSLAHLAHDPPLTHAEAALLLCKVGSALACAHAARTESGAAIAVVHRDVSPSNVMISAQGDIKLCDFGIARAKGIAASTIGARSAKGTYAYMSPEQAARRDLDGATDVFSLGLVVAERYAGEAPFRRANEWLTMQALQRCDEYEAPASFHPALAALVRDMLRLSPSERPTAASVSARARDVSGLDFAAARRSLSARVGEAQRSAAAKVTDATR